MSHLIKISPGHQVPDDVNVIIEIPFQSDPIKYEVEKETGALCVDRFLGTAMYYPCNYGYMPGTLAEDGDPVDILVVAPFPLLIGSVIRCRPVGILKMEDEAGRDSKILAVPIDRISPIYIQVKTYKDLPDYFTQQIVHFFEHYKDLEKGKWVKVSGWGDPAEAKAEILASVERCHVDKQKFP